MPHPITVNSVVWESVFEKQRRVMLSASMLIVHGRIQREGSRACRGQYDDLSCELAQTSDQDSDFPLTRGRGGEFHHGGDGNNSRDRSPNPSNWRYSRSRKERSD